MFELEPTLSRKFAIRQIRAAFVIGLTTNEGNAYDVLMVVPRSYPESAPAIYVLTHIKGQYRVAHIYGDDGRCCLFERIGRDWDPKECNLVTAIGWAAMWLFCQEYFQKYGRWPAPESHKSKPIRRTEPYDARRRR